MKDILKNCCILKKINNNPTKWKVITFESLPIFDRITTVTVFGNFNKMKNTFNLHLIICFHVAEIYT